jgi:hypothetical protein
MAQALATGTDEDKRNAKVVQLTWWDRVSCWKLILEEEYMNTRRIRYRPLTREEEGKVRINCIASIIRIKQNELTKQIKTRCNLLSNKYMVGKIQKIQLPTASSSSYVIHAPAHPSTSLSVFKCNGECSFAKQLREDLSVVQQTNEDTINKYLEKISVSHLTVISTASCFYVNIAHTTFCT